MKNKIFSVLSIFWLLITAFFLFIEFDYVSDDCYFGNGKEVTNLKNIAVVFFLINLIFIFYQVYLFIKNKFHKTAYILTAISFVFFLIYYYFMVQLNIKTAKQYDEIERSEDMYYRNAISNNPNDLPTYTNAQMDSISNSNEMERRYEQLESKKAIALRGCDSLVLIENQNSIELQTKGQKSFVLSTFFERNQNYVFYYDPSDKIATINGGKKYEIQGRRYTNNEEDGLSQPFAFSKSLNHPAIADYKVLTDFEANFIIAIGLNKGYTMQFEKGKLKIIKQ